LRLTPSRLAAAAVATAAAALSLAVPASAAPVGVAPADGGAVQLPYAADAPYGSIDFQVTADPDQRLAVTVGTDPTRDGFGQISGRVTVALKPTGVGSTTYTGTLSFTDDSGMDEMALPQGPVYWQVKPQNRPAKCLFFYPGLTAPADVETCSAGLSPVYTLSVTMAPAPAGEDTTTTTTTGGKGKAKGRAKAKAKKRYRKATKAERRAILRAERTSPDGFDEPYGIYVSKVRKQWAVNCTDVPGYSNWVFGRTFVKRHGRWQAFSSFNTPNVDSSWEYANKYPRGVYASLRQAIGACAARIGAEY